MPKAPTRPTQPLAAAETLDHSAAANVAMEAPEAARYIASFTGELSALAKQSGLDLLGYLLDMARLEADKQSRAGR